MKIPYEIRWSEPDRYKPEQNQPDLQHKPNGDGSDSIFWDLPSFNSMRAVVAFVQKPFRVQTQTSKPPTMGWMLLHLFAGKIPAN